MSIKHDPARHGIVDVPMVRPRSQPYRRSIDGLRALAILSVLVFHLKARWLPGGFVGVDVFFVISGFLITNLILHDDAHGNFSFAEFYQRRIARLFPSIFLVVVVTFAAAVLTYDPRIVADNGAHLAESILSVANIFSASGGEGYFGVARDAHPFLHFWSLSVEEQFYIFFPATLLLLRRFLPRHVAIALSAILVASFTVCVVMTHQNREWAFYMLPARAWELMVGALLAVAQAKCETTAARGWHSFLGWFGLLLTAGSILFVRSQNFPGVIAALPVLGTAAILAVSGKLDEKNNVHRLLSSKPLVTIGRLSYTLYLWHLPVFCLVDYRFFTSPSWIRLTLQLGLTTVLTLLTSYFVENPARRYFNQRSHRRHAYAFAAVMIVVTVPAALAARIWDWPEPRPSMVHSGGIRFNAKARHGSIALLGDSHACGLATTLRDMAKRHDMRLNVLCVSGSEPLPGDTARGWDSSLQAVQLLRPDNLVIELRWEKLFNADPQRLQEAITALQPYVKRIILITQPPTLPLEAEREAIRDGSRPPYRETEEDRMLRLQSDLVVRASASPSVLILDSSHYFLLPDGSIDAVENGKPLFFDRRHLSRLGESRLEPELEKLLLR